LVNRRKRLDPSREERVVGAIARSLDGTAKTGALTATQLQEAIDETERLFAELGEPMLVRPLQTSVPITPLTSCPSFDSLLATSPADASLADALTNAEISRVLTDLQASGECALGPRSLDLWDLAIAGVAGLLAGVADIVLVGLPRHTSVFGPDGGFLPGAVHNTFANILPQKTIASLETAFKVPYDHSTNMVGFQVVDGLFPNSHRYHALGHDPIFGWIVGVADVLRGTMTTIGQDGVLTVQPTALPQAGQSLFMGILGALHRVGGHMLSDVATSMGLPAPLMPLAGLLANPVFGARGREFADMVRSMYLEGYDFRQFLAGSITTAIVEVIVRGAWFVRRRREGLTVRDALPVASNRRLGRQLLLGHAVAAAVNAGKIAFTQSPCGPLALNWSQWLALFRYLGPEAWPLLHDAGARADAEDVYLDAQLTCITASIGRVHGPRLVL
jgi:hypothetical protein